MADKRQHLLDLAKTVKAKKFVNQYCKENDGAMPALSLVKEHKALTPEEEAKIDYIVEVDNLVKMAGDFDGGSIVVTGENISNLDIPADNAIKKVQASFAKEATVNFSSPKSVGVENLDKDGVIEVLTVNAPVASASTTITVSANCGTIVATNANVTVPAPYTVEKIVLVTEEGETNNISVNANFAEAATIETETTNAISVYNKNGEENLPSLNLDAENATVTLSSKWNEVEASVSVVTESLLAEGTSIDYVKLNIVNDNSKELGGVGEMTLMENITRSTSLVSPLAPAWNAVWNLNDT